jgi:large subunit ribosomal protein L6
MSRIGKKPVQVPAGVKFTIDGRDITVEGKLGSLAYSHRPEVSVTWDESEKSVTISIDEADSASRPVRAYWGLTRAIIQNMVTGVSEGFERAVEVVGVGWTAELAGTDLKLSIGYATPVLVPIPQGLDVTVDRNSFVRVRGADKQAVGQFAAEVRAKRKPEPYNGKGIRYSDEVIRRKQGKQFGA